MSIKKKYKCHLKKPEKDCYCLECQKKYVCDKPTGRGFLLVFGKTFEEHLKTKNEKSIEIFDYDWLNEK